MRILVIGGSGFVGRNLVNKLQNDGHEVAVLDKLRDSTNSFNGLCFLGDCQDPNFLSNVITQFDPSKIYHLAANSDIRSGVTDASLDFGDTLMTTVALRQSLKGSNVEQLVFASSSAIFGISENAFAEESESPAFPVSWYGKAKLASEYVLESLGKEIPELKILIVRFPNVVGPLATHGVIFDFVNKLKANPKILQVLGNGNQDKPYVHVHDLINGIEYFSQNQNLQLKRINLGPKDTSTVRFIAEAVSTAMGLTPLIKYQTTDYGWVGDVPKYSFDTATMNSEGFFIHSSSNEAVLRAAKDLVSEYSGD